MKRPTRKGLIRALDAAFAKYIIARDGRCVTCTTPKGSLQCGHLFSRVAYSTRWHEMNAACQCAGCNINHEGDPLPLTDYMIAKYGRAAVENLHAQYHAPVKFKDYQLVELTRYYKAKLAELGGGE